MDADQLPVLAGKHILIVEDDFLIVEDGFVVATGFSRELLTPPLGTAPHLAKPFARAEMIEHVATTSKPKDLRARRVALKIPHTVMAAGIRLLPDTILSIEANA